jgi:hypothetical protein
LITPAEFQSQIAQIAGRELVLNLLSQGTIEFTR